MSFAQKERQLWGCPCEFAQLFRASAAELGAARLEAVPDSLRHTGASRDVIEERRPLCDVKRRGRWPADSSMKRYLKGGRTGEQFVKLAAGVQQRCIDSQGLIGSSLVQSFRTWRTSSVATSSGRGSR